MGEEATPSYTETWELTVNMIEWTFKEQPFKLNLYDCGALFLRKFSFYKQQLLLDAKLIVHVFSFSSAMNAKQVEEQIEKFRTEGKKELAIITHADEQFGAFLTEASFKSTLASCGVTHVLILNIFEDSHEEVLEKVCEVLSEKLIK